MGNNSDTNLSFSVLTANVISLLLIGTLFLSNRRRIGKDKDVGIILRMMAITAVSNVADCCVFYLDYSSGVFFQILLFLCGSWLFLGNVLIGYTWARFLTTHLNIAFSKTRAVVYRAGGLIACALLIANVFYPLVFYYVGSDYKRGPVYGLFLLFAFLYIADSLYLYFKCRKITGTLKLFPVHVFLVPVVIGVVVQTLFYEVSIIWTSIAIAIAGIMTSHKNETIFQDYLTGLYNRVYLSFLQKQASRKKNSVVCGIMIDLDGFKQINDKFGHLEGDNALIITADVLRKSFGEHGAVTRFAGDEFVVMLNTTDEQFVKELIERAKINFEEANVANKLPYRLSASMGYATSDLSVESVDDFMSRIDKRMYRAKNQS